MTVIGCFKTLILAPEKMFPYDFTVSSNIHKKNEKGREGGKGFGALFNLADQINRGRAVTSFKLRCSSNFINSSTKSINCLHALII